jgi:hypothetical protein
MGMYIRFSCVYPLGCIRLFPTVNYSAFYLRVKTKFNFFLFFFLFIYSFIQVQISFFFFFLFIYSFIQVQISLAYTWLKYRACDVPLEGLDGVGLECRDTQHGTEYQQDIVVGSYSTPST